MFQPSYSRTTSVGQSLLSGDSDLDTAPIPRKGWFRTALSQLHIVLGFLWIAPAVTLLVLNHWSVIVGASIGCPRCKPGLSSNWQAEINKLSRDDHNALGALQVASKAFEVWFMFVAASLVYDVTMFMAERQGYPIPIGFMTAYLEFGDLRYFCDLSPWTTPIRSGATFMKGWHGTLKLYGFLAFVIVLSVTANLMGPGSAVLILPTLQFRNTSHVEGPTFKGLAMSNQPSSTYIAPNCTSAWLDAGNYTCFADPYALSLDALLADAAAGYEQSGFGTFNIGLSAEKQVTFLFNTTCYDNYNDCVLFLAPNRQILRNVSSDFSNYSSGILAPPLDNSLQTLFYRIGPSVVQNLTCGFGNVSVATVAEDRAVRCYGSAGSNFCVPTGRGWSHGNDQSNFSLGNTDRNIGDVTIDSYSSEVAANLTWDAVGCGATDESCWNSKFLTKTIPNIANITIIEFGNAKLSAPNRALYCMSWFYPSISRYELDPSGSNDINLVRITTSSQDTTAPHRVHPDWLLAAWSIERGGAAAASAQRVQVMVNAITNAYNNISVEEDTFSPALTKFSALQQLVFAQSMSLVDFATTPSDPSTKNTNPKLITLDTWNAIYVYSYGSDSRTATMGVVVLFIGITASLVRTVTAIVRRERTKSAFDLLTIALKHQYKREFRGKKTEAERARVRVGVDRVREEYVFRFETADGGGVGRESTRDFWGGSGSRSEHELTESPQMMRGGNGRGEGWGG